MRKLIFTLIGIALFLTGICQDTKPVAATFKQLQSPQFWFNSADTSVWMYKGNVYGWTQLQRTSKKYSIWNHTSITNTGWADGKVLGFNVSGNLVPLSTIIPATTATAIGTAAKTATISGYTLKTGDFIALTLTSGNSAAAMTLAINGGAAKNIRMNAVNTTTVFSTMAAGSVVLLYYDGTYFQMMGSQRTTDTDTDNFDRMYWNNAITAGVAIYDYKIIMQGTDGKFYPLTLETGTGTTKTVLTTELRIGSPILYYNTTTDVALNGSLSNVYSEFPLANMTYTFNVATWTSQQPVYLKGTVLGNGNFKLDNTTVTSFATQTLPTTDDGFVYILLGQMYSTTAMRLFQYHPIYQYKDGAIRQYIPTHTHNYEPPLGNPPVNGYVLASTAAGVRSWVANGTGGGTNLTYTASATDGIVVSDTGADATIPAGSTTNASLMLPADKTKLDGVATQADRYLRWYLRTSHGYTGIFSSDYLDFVAGSGVTIADNLTAGSRTITFSATGGSGTVTSVGMSVPTGLTVAGSPVTTNGTLAVSLQSGYSIPTTTNQTNWSSAYTHKTTEDALSGLVKVNGAGGYTAVTDNSTNWNSAVTNMGKGAVDSGTGYYNFSSGYFVESGGFIIPFYRTAISAGEPLAPTAGTVYTALALKADLAGAAFTGAVTNTSTFTATNFILSSDRRLKRNISPLKNTDWAKGIRFVSYVLKADSSKTIRYGVIAQDLEKIAPELVKTDKNGMKAVSYTDLIIAKLANMEQRINDLESEVKRLKRKNHEN